ncbi:hypothetical protein HZA33_03445 [Candidatus Pacearchaeota archaeon]|nr:hypothetical protein [Candidatus Pacearchaeota archaeon]
MVGISTGAWLWALISSLFVPIFMLVTGTVIFKKVSKTAGIVLLLLGLIQVIGVISTFI